MKLSSEIIWLFIPILVNSLTLTHDYSAVMSDESAPGVGVPPTEEEGLLGQTSEVPVVPEEPPRRQIVLPEELPAGAQPLFLSSVTQKLFKVTPILHNSISLALS